jgi:hypothetical protein
MEHKEHKERRGGTRFCEASRHGPSHGSKILLFSISMCSMRSMWLKNLGRRVAGSFEKYKAALPI